MRRRRVGDHHRVGRRQFDAPNGPQRAARASVARPHFPVEILAILDVPTAETQEYFARHAADFSQILRVAFEDLSLARITPSSEHAAGTLRS